MNPIPLFQKAVYRFAASCIGAFYRPVSMTGARQSAAAGRQLEWDRWVPCFPSPFSLQDGAIPEENMEILQKTGVTP